MSRIIINVKGDIPQELALTLVDRVVSGGRVSNYGKQYCYHSTFRVGPENKGFEVAACLTRSGTDSFHVWEER